jgi:hypothetical protein
MASVEPSAHRRRGSFPKLVAISFGLLLAAAMGFAVFNVWFLAATDHTAPIEEFPAVLLQHGLTAEAPRLAAGMTTIAHEKTFEVIVDSQPVWVMYFDPFDPAQAEARDKLKRDGSLEFGGRLQQAKVRGAVALVGYKGHPDEQKLLAAFNDFQTPDN